MSLLRRAEPTGGSARVCGNLPGSIVVVVGAVLVVVLAGAVVVVVVAGACVVVVAAVLVAVVAGRAVVLGGRSADLAGVPAPQAAATRATATNTSIRGGESAKLSLRSVWPPRSGRRTLKAACTGAI